MRTLLMHALVILTLVLTSCEAAPAPPVTVGPQLGGSQDGKCIETTLADASGTINSAFGRIGSGPLSEGSQYLIAVLRGAPSVTIVASSPSGSTSTARYSCPPEPNSRASPWGDVVWRVPLFKPAGGGCWKVPPEGSSDADGIVVRIDLR